jgi:hypothetical protein
VIPTIQSTLESGLGQTEGYGDGARREKKDKETIWEMSKNLGNVAIPIIIG